MTRSASQALPGLEPAGQRPLSAATRLSCGETGFSANLARWARSAAGRTAGLFAVIAGAYVAGAELAWHHFSSGLAFGYPPSGVDVAALLLLTRRRWLVVIAAIVGSEVGVDLQHHLTLAVALASSLANVVEPVTGASFVRWFCGGRRPDLTTRLGLSRFLLGAAVLGPVVGGLIGATVSWADNGGWWPGLVLQWWAGDGIAVLVIGAPVMLWAQRRALVSSRWLELVLVVLCTAGLSIAAFRFSEPSSLAADGRRFDPLTDGDTRTADMSAVWTIDSDAPGPSAVRNRTRPQLFCCLPGLVWCEYPDLWWQSDDEARRGQ